MTTFIIFTCLFATSFMLLFLCIYAGWHEFIFVALWILSFVSVLGMILFSAVPVKQNVKTIEYPASDYDFKIKVVEFEEQKDTILVVTPKEKVK